jgi:CRP-like cAMP-binding protein
VDMTKADMDLLGTMFILLDVIYIIHSLICLVSVARVVWNAANTNEMNEETTATRSVSVHPVSHRDLNKFKQLKKEIAALRLQKNIRQTMQNNKATGRSGRSHSKLKSKKSYRTTRVEEIQKNHQNHRDSAIKNIKKRQSNSRTSLELRVQARKKVKHSKALLKSTYFSALDPDSVSKIIDAMDFKAIRDNNFEMCRQGDVADIFYVIVSGACQVTIDGKPVAMLGAMDIFGESALFPGANGTSKRGATVTTKMSGNEDVQVLALRKIQFNALLASGTLNEDCLNKLKGVAEQRRQENARTTAVAKKQELGVKIGRGKTKGVGVVGK